MDASTESLFLEAISAGIHGERVRWDPLPPEQWGTLFHLAEMQKPSFVSDSGRTANQGR